MAWMKKLKKSRVVKVETWDLFITKATEQVCPVVVRFAVGWRMPSVAMIPFFEGLALSCQDILFLVVDVDEVKVAAKMEIKAMPTFVMMKEGTQMDKLVGANPDAIRKRVDAFAHSFR